MTTTVFLSGSRSIARLSPPARERLDNIMQRAMPVIIGDANGADKALQLYLAEAAYETVTIFAAGDSRCRNNLGAWEIRFINTGAGLKGRDFYAQKDKAMAKEADYGFILWDGESPGSIGNALELVRQAKPALIWFAPEQTFYTIKNITDLEDLLKRCSDDARRELEKKIQLTRSLRAIGAAAQPLLAL